MLACLFVVVLHVGSDSFDDALKKAEHRVIVLGGGPAGLSAAIYAARAEMQRLVVVSGESMPLDNHYYL